MMKTRREELAKNLKRIRDEIPKHLNLIVVTKTFPASDIEILYQLGERDFAENRVQELVAKRDELQGRVGSDARWHYQGQIQSNKISILNRYADVIHSLDQERHIEKIDSSRHVLLQVNLERSLMATKVVRKMRPGKSEMRMEEERELLWQIVKISLGKFLPDSVKISKA